MLLPYTPCENEPYSVDGPDFTVSYNKAGDQKLFPEISRREYCLNYKGEKRPIAHYAHEGWPDHGAANCEELFKLIVELSMLAGPVLVHCKGGIGRSGTLNVCRRIYKLYLEAKSKGLPLLSLDPVELVRELRNFRINSVEKPGQFEMILTFIEYLNAQGEPT